MTETNRFQRRENAMTTETLAAETRPFEADVAHVMKKLGNENFVARAAPEVVEEQRAKLAEAEAGKAKLQAALARLQAL